jgi:hypothetical protein
MPKDYTITMENGENDVDRATREVGPERLYNLIMDVDSDKPNQESLTEFRLILQKYRGLSAFLGDPVKYARETILKCYGEKQSVKLAVESEMDNLAGELASCGSSPLERLLIEHVVMCWLLYYETQSRSVTASQSSEQTMKQALFWESKLDAAQRRFLKASDQLSRTRKMLAPMQVNVGVNQVNVVSGTAPS